MNEKEILEEAKKIVEDRHKGIIKCLSEDLYNEQIEIAKMFLLGEISRETMGKEMFLSEWERKN